MGHSYSQQFEKILYLLILIQLWDECVCVRVPPGAIAGPKILKTVPQGVLYDGDSVEEFLSLCPKGCDVSCKLIRVEKDGSCNKEDQKTLALLAWVQELVGDFKARLELFDAPVIIQWIWYIIILLMGLYLIIVKHFHFRTLVDTHFPDPTEGMSEF